MLSILLNAARLLPAQALRYAAALAGGMLGAACLYVAFRVGGLMGTLGLMSQLWEKAAALGACLFLIGVASVACAGLQLWRGRGRGKPAGKEAMTFDEALAALDAGEWVRRPCFVRSSRRWFIAHRDSLRPEWIANWPDDAYFSVNLDDLSDIGPTAFGEKERAATDWGLVELPERDGD